MNPEKELQAYYDALIGALPPDFSPEAFFANQSLSLFARNASRSTSRPITYFVQELDGTEVIPGCQLTFLGSEAIDEEHFFLFFKGNCSGVYNKLTAAGQILRATVALVPLKGRERVLVQHVEAIPEIRFEQDHKGSILPPLAHAG